MDNEALQVLQEIRSEVKGARFNFVLLLLAIIGFSAMIMVMLQDVRLELRSSPAQPAVAAPAK